MWISCAGGATPPPAFFEALASLKQLKVLEVLPGVYGQIAGYDMDVGQGDPGWCFSLKTRLWELFANGGV
jgi:hypothetical protein